MTVQQLINKLQELGPEHMNDPVLIHWADYDGWYPVTGITSNTHDKKFATNKVIKLTAD